ncbi:MAG: GNAT family N-acetyltransferase [Candidatus Bathyarchaeota archaeon]
MRGKDFISVQLDHATTKDIPELTRVMTRAFDDDSQKHLGKPKGGPSGYDNGDFFRKWMPYKESVTYKMVAKGKTIGGIIVWIYKHGRNGLGTIFVDPDYQDQGIGTRAWSLIEETYPDTKSWTLGTPSWATKNHHFYEKNGFRKIREEATDDIPEGVSFIYSKAMDS